MALASFAACKIKGKKNTDIPVCFKMIKSGFYDRNIATTWYQLFKEAITCYPVDGNASFRIHFIHRIATCPLNRVIRSLDKWGLKYRSYREQVGGSGHHLNW